ncbi:Nucleotidyl transferase AbiEii toxin, Type IV TA system [Dokdonella immobilis]|uniref:Nucleotidyl transferase AbiEii toxin, Type IV TA system n=1 Tax=Dokdonella immobilis TaxID=578942 RepID=A0A1I4ZBZ4_9GAMM|nr:Nucleotidyl transferase AbiEii toxin, Type IV TA system [Dokdonella immobilis]
MRNPRADSVRGLLLNRARQQGEDYNQLLTRYALERWLYRLSASDQQPGFVLKGALLFALWFDEPHRPTRDADFLGFGEPDPELLRARVQSVCTIACDDGMRFDPESVQIEPIREQANYEGLRAELLGRLGTARCNVQLDVGYGDAITPEAQQMDYPTILADLPVPRLRTYPKETVLAEKLEATIVLGMRNSRMKDYFDMWVLLRRGGIDSRLLGAAIQATCERRGTPLPESWPIGWSAHCSSSRTTSGRFNVATRHWKPWPRLSTIPTSVCQQWPTDS